MSKRLYKLRAFTFTLTSAFAEAIISSLSLGWRPAPAHPESDRSLLEMKKTWIVLLTVFALTLGVVTPVLAAATLI